MRSDADQRPAAYLSDHLAGSFAALRLIQRRADREPDSALGRLMAELLQEIRADRAELERVMAAVGASSNPVKHAGAIGAELFSSLRSKVPLVGSGSEEVARLEELELLSMGVEGKRLLWKALESCALPALEGFDLAALAERAQGQRERLEPFRRAAAADAFGPADDHRVRPTE
jgi:hypothetical protein